MSTSYEQFCPVARTLDVIGERWTILILRDLLLEGPRKFHQLQGSLTGVSPNTLSARLKRLEEYRVIAHRFYEQHPPRAEYLLTDKGRALGPALAALRDWGLQHAGGRMHPKYRALETAPRPRGGHDRSRRSRE